MAKNELKVASEVVELAGTSNMDKIERLLANENIDILLRSMAQVAGEMSSNMFQAVSKIYSQAIVAQVMEDARELQSKDEAMRRYNDQVDKILDGLDFTDTVKVENVNRTIENIGRQMDKAMARFGKKSLFSRLGLKRKM